jgi:hypothetical protein
MYDFKIILRAKKYWELKDAAKALGVKTDELKMDLGKKLYKFGKSSSELNKVMKKLHSNADEVLAAADAYMKITDKWEKEIRAEKPASENQKEKLQAVHNLGVLLEDFSQAIMRGRRR